MKKIFSVILVFFVVMGVTAQTITVLHSGDTVFSEGTSHFKNAENLLKKDFPNVKVEYIKIDLSDGSTLTMDAMLAAGEAPNVYLDTTVRTSKYMIPEYALPLENLVTDLKDYTPGNLDPYYINGHLLGIPVSGSAQGMAINLDMMKDIGFVIKPNWTISDFMKMAELVKQKYGGKKWATGMFAGNQSGDYLINNWYASFGAQWYKNGEYNKSIVAEKGAKVYEFFQTLVKNGYVPPNSATLVDDDYVIQWAKGDLAATAFFPSWTKPYFDTVIQQGIIKKPFNYEFVPFPRADGVTKVGTYFSGSIAVIHKTGTPADKVAARFVQYLNNNKTETLFAEEKGMIPDKIGIKDPSDPYTVQVMKIVATQGIFDFGLTDRRFTERRALQFPILQQVLNLKITPEVAIKKFQDALNGVK